MISHHHHHDADDAYDYDGSVRVRSPATRGTAVVFGRRECGCRVTPARPARRLLTANLREAVSVQAAAASKSASTGTGTGTGTSTSNTSHYAHATRRKQQQQQHAFRHGFFEVPKGMSPIVAFVEREYSLYLQGGL